ncbi:hypothetical protein [Paenibacillus hexagrammi]|uniref:Histidine kinase n=1 Tax=Paenibacillus hexagrammi TaxID=2908839 RepID=A0ABY3SET9_9BACL|nr:hypothetical protein [Paenibacillus sp. YPD9-1]UJF32508.1 hypothetical protein L0M14_22965 [Paenibacillus sp. YPD9-1]
MISRLEAEQTDLHLRHDHFKRVGLSNLIYRLRMFYYSEAKINFYNSPSDGGAVVEIELPLVDKLKGESE